MTERTAPRATVASRLLPGFVAPCLATLRKSPPGGADWAHEAKLDGYRLIAGIDGRAVQLFTRSGLDWTDRFPAVASELASLNLGATMLDGEAVVRTPDGATDFGALVRALKSGGTEHIEFIAFDILYLDGQDMRVRRYDERKTALAALFRHKRGLRLVHALDSLPGEGRALLDAACALGFEGIVSKRRDAPYRSGRQLAWIKSKCLTSEDFAIVGYLPSKADRDAVGALVVATKSGRALAYAGRVGTGFTHAIARDLMKRLAPLAAARPLSVPRGTPVTGVVWTKPLLTARVNFREQTADGILRHAVFKGLREDL